MNSGLSTGAVRGKLPGGLLAAALLALLLLVGYQIYLSYRHQIKLAEISTRNLAAVFETRFDATLRRTDADLQALALVIPAAALNQNAVARYQRTINADLDSRLFNMEEMAGYRVHDANGDTLYASDNAHTARVNIADRPYFRLLRDNPGAGLVFSDVVTGRSLGRPVLVIVRGLRDERGRFMGIVHGMIELDYYQKRFQALDVGAHGLVALRRSDTHAQLVHWPAMPDGVNQPLAEDHPVVLGLAGGGKAVTLHYAAAPDNVMRIVGIQVMQNYPFYFAVGLARNEVLVDWRTQTLVVTLSTLLLFAFVGALLIRLRRMRVREAEILEDLAQSEAQYRKLAQMVPVGICHFDGSGCYTYVNDRHLQLTGRSRSELLGRSWSDFVHPEDLPRIRELWRNSQGEPYVCEYRYVHPDGRWTHVLGEVQIETGADGKMLGCIVAQTDISLRKRAEEELLLAKLQAESANIAKSRFLAAASHDLRQPIQAINLFRDALSRTELSEEQKVISNYLSRSVHLLGELLYSLLDISKLDAGQVRPQMKELPVEELFKAVDAEFSTLALQKKLRFKLFYPFKDMVVLADPGLILSVLRNLIGNALKYTERGGVLVAARKRHNSVLIQVWDTGIGIEPQYGEQIFDEFFQIGNRMRDRAKGLGLGLAIARRMAQLFDGKLSYRSRFGQGSVFEISLPLAGADAAAGTREASASAPLSRDADAATAH